MPQLIIIFIVISLLFSLFQIDSSFVFLFVFLALTIFKITKSRLPDPDNAKAKNKSSSSHNDERWSSTTQKQSSSIMKNKKPVKISARRQHIPTPVIGQIAHFTNWPNSPKKPDIYLDFD